MYRALLCEIFRVIGTQIRWSEILKVEWRFYTTWSLKGTVVKKFEKVLLKTCFIHFIEILVYLQLAKTTFQ